MSNLTPRERALVDSLQEQFDGLTKQVTVWAQRCEAAEQREKQLLEASNKSSAEVEALTRVVNGLCGQLAALDPNSLKRWAELPALVETLLRRDRQREETAAKQQEQYEMMSNQWNHLCSVLGSLND